MKKLLVPFILMLLIISACSSNETSNKETKSSTEEKKSETITYQSENGPVEVPADPQRIVLLSGFAGNVLALDGKIAGADVWSKSNPTYKDALKDVPEVSEENLESIIEAEPDLIIALSTVKNIDKIKKIAPTVTFTWGKLGYLDQHVEIGKLLNKEKEAQAWVNDFKQRAEAAGKEIKEKIGEDATVSVIETYDKQLYVFGNNWARGTEILYQAMGLNMPEKVKEKALEPGYYTISAEVLPEFAGDYIILSKYDGADVSFQKTETYKNIPAVKNNRVFELNGNTASFIDPITLDNQLEFFKKSFLEN